MPNEKCFIFEIVVFLKVFIAGRNRLYQLSTDLDILETVETGPLTDSTNNLVDNIHTALFIDYKSNHLITCESFQGQCLTRSLLNISNIAMTIFSYRGGKFI